MNDPPDATPPLSNLKRFVQKKPKPVATDRCDFCDVEVTNEHGHVVNISSRSLLCVCRACALLFAHDGAAGGRYRAVPDRYIALDDDEDLGWDALQIPVGIAFFFFNSAIGRVAAFYPSPAGATESLLPLDTGDVIRAHPYVQQLAPDVEALLVRRTHDRLESFIVPIDACYALVGSLRRHWRGFDGGEDARRQIDYFFARLRERSQPLSKSMAAR